jgi:agmatinase
MPRYQPPDASLAPRYTGIRTFARAPHVPDDLEHVDVAVVGVPFDTATTMRPGARFGRPPSGTPASCCGRGTRSSR